MLDKLSKLVEVKLESFDKSPIDFKDYNFSEQELKRIGPVLEKCISKSEMFFWLGYKEAIETMKKMENNET